MPGSKGLSRCGFTVEANDGDSMFHAADQRVEDRIQLLVINEVICSRAASLNDDSQRQRLQISTLIERKSLWNAVVGEGEVVSRELKEHLSCLGLDKGGHLHQS